MNEIERWAQKINEMTDSMGRDESAGASVYCGRAPRGGYGAAKSKFYWCATIELLNGHKLLGEGGTFEEAVRDAEAKLREHADKLASRSAAMYKALP